MTRVYLTALMYHQIPSLAMFTRPWQLERLQLGLGWAVLQILQTHVTAGSALVVLLVVTAW